MISFHPTDRKLPGYMKFSTYKLYRGFIYTLYSVFPIYGVSTCVPGHINASG
jgi:hypothetical protein